MTSPQLASFERLLQALRVKHGDWRLEGRCPSGNAVALEVAHGAEQTSVVLDAGKRGVSRLTTFADPSLSEFANALRQGAAPNWQPIAAASRLLPANLDNPDLWDWLGKIDIAPTVLVIPGLSAIRTRLPAIEFGAISIPACVASLSLRSVAIDLVHGSVAATLTLNDAVFDGTTTLLLDNSTRAQIADGSMVLHLDLTYSYAEKTGSIWLQSLQGRANGISVGGIQAAAAESQAIHLSGGATVFTARDVWYAFDTRETIAKTGELVLQCVDVTGSAENLVFSDELAVSRPRLSIGRAEITSHINGAYGATAMRVRAMLTDVSATFEAITIAPTATLQLSNITPGDNGALFADHLDVVLMDAGLRAFAAGLALQYGSAEYDKAGFTLEISPPAGGSNHVVLNLAQDALTRQSGFRLKVATAQVVTGNEAVHPITLNHLTVNRYCVEHLPCLPPSHRTKISTAVNDIRFDIEGFSVRVIDPRRIRFPWSGAAGFLGEWGLLNNLDVAGALSWLQMAVGQPLDWLGSVTNWLSLGQIRIESVEPYLNTLPVRVKFEPTWSDEQRLAFKVVGGISAVGVNLSYSYPAPKWDDWGNRDESSLDQAIPLHAELELLVRVQLDVNPVSRRIGVTNVGLDVPIGVPDEWKRNFARLQEAGQGILLDIYGLAGIQKFVSEIVEMAMPIRIPDQWEVSRLTIDRSSDTWGVGLSLRYEEHLFM